MIEVEKSFDTTEEQLERIIEGAEFLGEVVNHDIYYDYPDLRMAKQKIKLRMRNGAPEIKAEISELVDKEIEDIEEIKKFLNIDTDLNEFITANMVEITNYKNRRRKYKKEGINIDVDNLDFGLSSCDFEIMVHDESAVPQATARILEFAKSYGLDVNNKNIGKRQAYLKKFKPEVYNKIYGQEE
jgi:adenylate cyclase class IV